jgi:predicted nuclease of predicted toxin-antitoxin system
VQNLKAHLKNLLTHEVDFVLIGGFEAVVHGSKLVTQDLDIGILDILSGAPPACMRHA